MEKSIIGICSGIVAAISAAEIGALVLMIISIIGTLLNVIMMIWNLIEKIKKAASDGVITDEERKEIIEGFNEAAEEVKKEVDKYAK